LNGITDNNILREFILRCLEEDVGSGDHTSLACIPSEAMGKAQLLVKEKGVIAGVTVAGKVFEIIDPSIVFSRLIEDGTFVAPGDTVFTVSGSQQSILKSERLVLNIMQRMSGIATITRQYTEKIKGLKAKILDTRKTTPGMRFLEKEAVRIGGGYNHRIGLYDMIMLKDNHVDYAGGIEQAITKAREYLLKNKLDLRIVIEARNIDDVRRIIKNGGVDRILLDNFSPETTLEAVRIIGGRYEIESSGSITLDNVRVYAECGVDFISAGTLTHSFKSLDLSLKAFRT
jgi:nicotinate-nucleotide pyrophosphorylase (carboxylating)